MISNHKSTANKHRITFSGIKYVNKCQLTLFIFPLLMWDAGCIVVLWDLENDNYFPIQKMNNLDSQQFKLPQGVNRV